jgi:hypothetical protein
VKESLQRGGKGDDTIIVSGAFDGFTIYGDSGNDKIQAQSVSGIRWTAYGGRGDDVMDVGTDLSADLFGQAGDDDLYLKMEQWLRHS